MLLAAKPFINHSFIFFADRPTSTSSVQRQPSDRRPDANASSSATSASANHQQSHHNASSSGGNNNPSDTSAAAQSIDGESGGAADQETDTRDR